MIYYPKPMHLQTAFKTLGYKEGDFPTAEGICDRVIALPMHPYMDDAQIMEVSGAVKEILTQFRNK